MNYKLVKFDKVSEAAYMDYISEWEANEETVIPYAARREGQSFDELQKRWQKETTDAVRADGYVPSTLYFLEDNSQRILGAIHFRHELNDHLMMHGGHIGYGVRASERQKGIAGLMLKLMLEKVKSAGIERALLTCEDLNIGSAKTIESNGGKLENKVSETNHKGETVMIRRYWIDLT